MVLAVLNAFDDQLLPFEPSAPALGPHGPEPGCGARRADRPVRLGLNATPAPLLGGQDGVLRAVRDGGEVLWTKAFDGPLGTPLLADLDGDGKLEAVVSVGDGTVYVLGP
jgi:hypothetical protein